MNQLLLFRWQPPYASTDMYNAKTDEYVFINNYERHNNYPLTVYS